MSKLPNPKKPVNPMVEFLRSKNQGVKKLFQIKPIRFHGSRHRG